MNELNSNNCSLDGIYLIEASAGTGKTYNIQNLAVRLILEKNLKIDEILITTFTRAATAELTDRIRGIIQSSFDYLDLLLQKKITPEEKKYSREYELLTGAVKNFSDEDKLKECRRKLQQALLDFDNNAISTIHGFCQRMLKKNAFESGILFQTELTGDDQIKNQICALIRNQWRKICYEANQKYIGLYRGLLPFDLTFIPKQNNDRDDYRLLTESTYKSKTGPKYLSGYAGLSLDDFIKLIEKPEMVFDRQEDTEPDVLAEKIYDCLDHLKVNAPDLSIPNKESDAADIPLKEIINCPLEYSFGWNMFESLVYQADFERWDGADKTAIQAIKDNIKELEKYMLQFRVSLLNNIRQHTFKQLAELKQRDNFQTYNDLQKRMIEALNAPGSKLAETLQKQFKAAIIDEFQDTDQGQYEIFSRIFAPGLKDGENVKGTLFFVGDPKQAIYAFRGGDIFTYKGASSDVGEAGMLTLNKNFRSADVLVESVNEIFSSHPFAFADSSIKFEKVKSSGKKTLKFNGEPDQTPFHYLAGGTSKVTVYEKCAEKICQILTSDVQMPDPDSDKECNYIPVKPSDIAILCRTMSDQNNLLEQLQRRMIPYVTAAEINIYDTQEARDLEKLLLAVLSPTDLKAVTWLMQTALVQGKNCRTLCRKVKDVPEQTQKPEVEQTQESAVIQTQEILSGLNVIFEQKGFSEMFGAFMNLFEIHERYPALPQGQQKYSNLIQLRDILSAEEKKGNKSPGTLTLWLQKQISAETRTDVDSKVLLPTDTPAVKIMTIHNSKGLQFPIVFLPDLASFEITADRSKKYHDPENNKQIFHRLTNEKQTDLALAEALQEELRVAYVALTRASRASYLLIQEKSKKTKSKMKNIFNAVHWLYTAKDIPVNTPPQNLKDAYFEKERNTLFDTIGNKIEFVEKTDIVYRTAAESELTQRKWENYEIAAPSPKISYSSAHKYFRRNENRSRSDEETSGELNSGVKKNKNENLLPVFTLPRGDLFGTACHTIMEKWNFNDENKLRELIARHLSVVNIKDKTDIAVQMFKNAVTAPVPLENESSFTLNQLTPSERCSELDFDFNLNRNFNPAEIGSILNRYYGSRLDQENLDLLYAIRNQTGEAASYTGSADLIVCHGGKYYIVDWKTDILEETPESFNPENLFGVMWQKFYLYQSLLYSSALIRFLSLRLKKSPREVYDQDFGGVRYLFLRGIDPDVPGRGIYADKPDFELICKIAEVE